MVDEKNKNSRGEQKKFDIVEMWIKNGNEEHTFATEMCVRCSWTHRLKGFRCRPGFHNAFFLFNFLFRLQCKTKTK